LDDDGRDELAECSKGVVTWVGRRKSMRMKRDPIKKTPI
jgi:hypothetical protein